MLGPRPTVAFEGSDPLLRAALGSIPYGFSLWDEERRLILFNQRYIDLYGYPPGELKLGMSLREVCELTVRVGNHPGVAPASLYALYAQRLDACSDPNVPLRAEKAVRDLVIKATHIRAPGVGWVVTHEDITEEIEQRWAAELREKTLATQSNRFNTAIDNMSHGLSIFDGEMRLVTCNRRYLEIYGLPDALSTPGTPLLAIVEHRSKNGTAPDNVEDFVGEIARSPEVKERFVETTRLLNGRVMQITRSPVEGGGFVGIHQDVTEDHRRVAALEASEQTMKVQNVRFDAAVNHITQGLCMFDSNEQLVICNNSYARMYTLPDELTRPGTPLSEILDYRFSHGMGPIEGPGAFISEHDRLIANDAIGKHLVEQQDGRSIIINHHPMRGGGWVATHEDITEQRTVEARIHHLARHDGLTGLPNRTYFSEEMEKAEGRLKRGEVLAALCVDLDHFKAVNDTLGHAVGDRVLAIAAERLREAARETDIVARLGGDEFAILLGGLDGPADAAAVANRVVKLLGDPMLIEERDVMVGASVGIAVAPTDGTTAETLLKNADLALYRAKSEGRGTYHFFEKGMDRALQHRRALEQGLKIGLARNEFRLMFQPLVDLGENSICCLEALLRWDHPEHGVISPMEFIPIAEETGMIVPIGEWVLREACRVACDWPEHIRVAVNLSSVQFKNRALVNQVTSALNEAGLDPRRLELEVTESLLLTESELTLETLHRLRALGVRISMDDFGTGYSSLSYLRAFPFDKIKIDRSFIAGLKPEDDSGAIVKAIIGLGRSLGMSTTAEGIETEEQLETVRAHGCDEVQGYLFSPPLPVSGIEEFLRTTPVRHKSKTAA